MPAVKLSPDSAALHMLAGEAYDRLNRTEEAIQEFKSAKEAAPFLPRIHFYLGYLHWERREYEEAAVEFEAERASPTGERAQAEGYLGDIAMRNGDTKSAELLLKSALRTDDRVHIAHLDLGIIYAEQNRFADAQRELEAAIALASNRVDAYYRLAQVYRAQGKLNLQQAMLSKVKQINEAKRLSVESVLRDSPPDFR
jgi:tetratricopeptide (TPR) repeat protein